MRWGPGREVYLGEHAHGHNVHPPARAYLLLRHPRGDDQFFMSRREYIVDIAVVTRNNSFL